MFGSNTLDVAIGLISLFLLLSLMASAVNELIEAKLKQRSKNLAKGITELIGSGGATTFINQLYDHGLINSLFRGKYSKDNKELPSYIPSRNFALAVIDVAKTFEARAADAKAKDPNADLEGMNVPPNVKSALETLKEAAGGKLDVYEKSVEDWYNSAMDRVSGWYKRRSQWIIFSIGLGLAIIANADCINYAKRLSTDASLQKSAVAFAENIVKNDPTKDDPTKTPVQRFNDDTLHLSEIGLPLGWQGVEWKADAATAERPFGWLLTAIAVSLGAPFWFDMLNKIMVIRSTVKPHEKSKEEKAKDPTGSKVGAGAAGTSS
jgi:hypothetical protein